MFAMTRRDVFAVRNGGMCSHFVGKDYVATYGWSNELLREWLEETPDSLWVTYLSKHACAGLTRAGSPIISAGSDYVPSGVPFYFMRTAICYCADEKNPLRRSG